MGTIRTTIKLPKEIKLSVRKLRNFPGIHLAMSWITADHDYSAALKIESFMRRAIEAENDAVDEIPSESLFCLTRLRSALTREAIGLTPYTEEVPELMAIIDADNEASTNFKKLRELARPEVKEAHPMQMMRNMRDDMFHKHLREHEQWYRKAFDGLLKEKNYTIAVIPGDERFAPTDVLNQRVFLKEMLNLTNMKNAERTGAQIKEVSETLVDLSAAFLSISRAISNGLFKECRAGTASATGSRKRA